MKITKQHLRKLIKEAILEEDDWPTEEEMQNARPQDPYGPGGRFHHVKRADEAGVMDVKEAVYETIPALLERVAALEAALAQIKP